jgi:uncharacterized protein YecE (DUF72 family)
VSKTHRSDLRVGISGWRYPGWRKTFYPPDLTQRAELEFASRQLNSIEINGSFYSLQTPSSYAAWAEQTPEDFVFSAKGGRYITHMKRLTGGEQPLANYFASGLLRLGKKLGPILWQFPPSMKFDAAKVEAFFQMLPHDTEEAAELAGRHGKALKGRAWAKTDAKRPVRHVVEVRNESFLCEEFIALLRKFKAALCTADTAGLFPFAEDVTADFVYLRLHGAEEIYRSGYSDEQLDRWAGRIKRWAAGSEPADARRVSKKTAPRAKRRDVYVYFDNDVKVRAPFDAMNLARKLGIETPGADGYERPDVGVLEGWSPRRKAKQARAIDEETRRRKGMWG